MATGIDPEAQKQAVKEALTEWLDAKFAEFGWFSLKAIVAVAFGGLVYAWFVTHGWRV